MSMVTRFLLGFFVFLFISVSPVAAHAAVHTVSPGESLYIISTKYGIPLSKLMEANAFQGSTIYPGQKIYVPNESSRGSSYTVLQGDTLYLIGRKFGVSYQEIMSANKLSSSNIYPGMVLYIPQSIAPVSRGGTITRATPAEVDLLARLITAEADAEPYTGKVAVGAVVLNRVRSSIFPNTIRDVVNQYDKGTYQFEPVMNGWINRPATVDCINAAKDALYGVDPTNGALYFFATYVTNKWLWAKPLSKIIGNTAFTF